MQNLILEALLPLKSYCEKEGFKGWDPYDGLNSKVFKALPLVGRSALCRLVVIQGFKRCPVNLRPLALVPKEYNAKGIALLLQAYCNLHTAVTREPQLSDKLGEATTLEAQVNELARLLISLKSVGVYHGACWGYNFDWQARRLFLFPKGTPTVVATTFAATALMAAYEITGNNEYLTTALSAAEFVMHDLHRTPHEGGFLFSYSPLPGNDTVFNASLLGSRLLSFAYHYTGKEEYREAARASVQACSAGQRADGAWVYGMLPVQSWVDSFHTGYNLDAMIAYERLTGDMTFAGIREAGMRYYVSHFFEADGCPKYYDNAKWPIDIHCPAQLLVSLRRADLLEHYSDLAQRVLRWTIDNMQDKREGYFYYQLKRWFSSRISYMRWSNAFMMYALSYALLPPAVRAN